VVGGGTAGLAVATRISQGLPESSILVLEAGPDAVDESRINIPGLKGSTIGTQYDWNFTTVPQPHAGGRRLGQARGKVLGGSSAMNLMTWDRASAHEYDVWEELGNEGWNWRTMIRNMLKVESFVPSDRYGKAGVGEGGPIQTLINRYVPPQQDYFIPTLENLGSKANLESLDGNPLGVMFQPSNIRDSDYKRSYSAHNPGYASLAGSNLYIQTNTRVRKINLHQRRGRLVATGVTLEDNSTIHAEKEVILSAGSFQSPGLLELSGIGDKSILSAAGIPCLLNLPGVGEHLQDHVRIENSYQLLPNYTSFDALRYNTTFAAQQLALYNASMRSAYDYTGSGYAFVNWKQALGNDSALLSLARQAAHNPLTSSPFERTRAKILLDYLHDESKHVPQVEVIFSDGYTGVKGYPPVSSPLYGASFFTLIASIQHPFSLGSVHITSPSLTTPPSINPNYLAQEYDIQATIAAAQYLRQIANTAPLRGIWSSEYEPGLAVVGSTGPDADSQWRTYVTNNSLTIYHPVGTCAMLPRSQNGVVDADLMVHGTRNLRVVDASVIPVLLSAHIQTAVYGIAEMAAERIIESWAG